MEQPVKNELRPRTLRFGVFEVDPCTQELRKQGVRVRLPAQSIQILLMLLETPGQLVNREELRKKLWPQDTFVDFDHGVNAAVNRLREALGDSAEKPKFIETLPRRGYRFTAAIEGGGENSAVAQPIPSELNKAVVESAPRIGKRWRIAAIAAGSVFCLALAFGIWLMLPPPQPRVLRSTQLTNNGKRKCCVVTDGSRVYFTEEDNGGIFRIKYIAVTGGDPITIPTPSLEPFLSAIVSDISPDHDRLLVERATNPGVCSLWIVPVTGSSPRPLTNLRQSGCGGSRWSPDGQMLVYSSDPDILLARTDGTEPRRLVTTRGAASLPVWSPDGSTVRFTVTDTKSNTSSLFEVSAEGGEPHEVTPHWKDKSFEYSGMWSPDGRYFLFLSGRNGRPDIWAIREHQSFPGLRKRDPIQLTAGSLEYWWAAFSPDGRRIFADGSETRGEVERFAPKTAQFQPFLQGLSADCCVYSNDGKWMAYVTYPEGSLWRSRPDGSQRQQLTWPPMHTLNPHWSPDGKEIAFSGRLPGRTWKTLIIPADGGDTRQLTQNDCSELDANWSPDGTHLTFAPLAAQYVPSTSCPTVIYTMDLRTHEISTIPGSEGLWSPRWSPDGKRIMAQTSSMDALMIYETTFRKWSELIRPGPGHTVGFQQWSRDGKLVYYRAFGLKPAVYSIRIEDHKTERVADLMGIQTTGNGGDWAAITPRRQPAHPSRCRPGRNLRPRL